MSHRDRGNNYVIISAVKDEGNYVETTIKAVLGQTARPSAWIIVDDNSRDDTSAVLERCTNGTGWIRVLRLDRDGKRQLGSAVVRAFTAGYELLGHRRFDFVVKLDCDLDFDEYYFEQLMGRFQKDHRLGIASGIYLERNGERWSPVKLPEYHAAGAAKMIRKQCFVEIGGFVPSRGWDTVDEIRAQVAGWKTRHFQDLKFYHLKSEGSAAGSLRTSLMHGEVYYLTGGGKLFLLLKVLHRLALGRPFLVSGFMLLLGFLRAWMSGRERLVTESEARFYRQLLNKRILNSLKRMTSRIRPRGKAWRYT